MTHEETLTDLARRSAEADMEAFEALVRELHGDLFYFLHLLQAPDDDVEDIAQDTVIEIHRSLISYDASRSFLPWMRSIARNVLGKYWRTRARRQRREGVFRTYVTGLPSTGATAPECSAEHVRRLRTCLESLQAKQREVIEMRYFRNLDSSQIGAAVGLTATAVRRMLWRVRRALKACVEGQLRPEGG